MESTHSPLQMAVNSVLDQKGRVWLTGSPPENRHKYATILNRVRPDPESGRGMKVDLLCGELSAMLFDDIEVVNGFKWVLGCGAKVRIIFHRGKDATEAVRFLRKTNPCLYELWERERDNFTIYYSPITMQQHFLAISKDGVILEKPGTTKSKQPWWAFFERDEDLAEKWTERFEQYIDTELLTELSPEQDKPTTQN
jgi:hypothetical protein